MPEDKEKKCNISVPFSVNSYFLLKIILAILMTSEDYLNINTLIIILSKEFLSAEKIPLYFSSDIHHKWNKTNMTLLSLIRTYNENIKKKYQTKSLKPSLLIC